MTVPEAIPARVLPPLSVGASPLGGAATTYGYDVEETVAIRTVQHLLASPVRSIDTSNQYSGGESERRIGRAIEASGGLPDDFVLATKADPLPGDTSFSGERVRRSFLESTARLGGARFGVFYLHDPEWFDFDTMVGPGSAVEAMVDLKREGLVDAIGVAGGDLGEMRRYVDLGVFDVVLNHNRYTLLDRSAGSLIDHAIESGVAFVNAAPYASGILARPAAARPTYRYRPPSYEIVATTARLREACARHDVPLPAVALQFSTRDTRIASTVVGVSAPQRVDELVENDRIRVPADLWNEVADIIDTDLSHLST
ncbi:MULTISPECIES: aldo/keto reductase [unclassified Microbacterium]|uniref:aldo/keto reductase n=1 Tax=unclassified Microbacterium TaxID=2609290 RepID=UPI000D51ECA6|nr:aldo/keto reductase [Microbacterium sp. TPD7012]PVE96863.1 oxidoreductase [Microbacterium sp. TPD7012]